MIKFHEPMINGREVSAVSKVLRSGWLGKGRKVDEFEDKIKGTTGAKYAVALNSCTACLYYAIRALTEPGDKVIVPAITFAATANVVEHLGREVMFIDVDKDTLNMNQAKLFADKCWQEARAIIPVHFAGQPCHMDVIMKYVNACNITVIEDCAQAFGAKLEGIPVGRFGRAGCFSFHVTKNITTGTGGVLITDDNYLADAVRILSGHGQHITEKFDSYEIVGAGLEDYMTDINAAIGLVQLEKRQGIQNKRARLWERYIKGLQDVNRVTIPLMISKQSKQTTHSYFRFNILLDTTGLDFTRDEFIGKMYRRGIHCKVRYRPLHLEPYYRKKYGYKIGDFPVAEYIGENIVTLPFHNKMSIANVDYVVETLKTIIEEKI